MSMSNVVNDRVEFKLQASKYHLDRLKQIQRKEGSLSTWKYFEAQVELEGFFSQLTGTIDALLSEINSKMNLGLSPEKITLRSVNKRMEKAEPPKGILTEINQVSKPAEWLGQVYEYRNHGLHRGLIPNAVELGGGNFRVKDYLMREPRNVLSGRTEEETIPCLEKSLHHMRQLVDSVRKKLNAQGKDSMN